MTGDERPTAVILDDHQLWLSALESILEEASVTVVGKAATALSIDGDRANLTAATVRDS